jgi:murein DD-endopeptidase MepM/ murein hydrolase activator NlpD
MKKKTRAYTIVFIPEDQGKTFSIRIQKNILISIFFSIFLFIAGVVFLIYNTGVISVKLQLVHTLKSENQKLKNENKKLFLIHQKVQSIESFKSYLTRIITASSGAESVIATIPPDNGTEPSLLSDDSLDNYIGKLAHADSDSLDQQELSKTLPPGIIPVQGWVTKRFAPDSPSARGAHAGIDIAATEGSLIRSSWSGTVRDIGMDKYLGLIVTIIHPNNYLTIYGHCSQVLIAKGDHVEAGQAVALVGNTGRSSGPHLHFEVKSNGKNVDPLRFIYKNSVF